MDRASYSAGMGVCCTPASRCTSRARCTRRRSYPLGGVEYSNFTPDFGPPDRLTGIGAYVDFNWNSRYAIEGETRFLRFNGFNGEYEDNYLAGPKISVFRHGKFRPYAKVLFGVGRINFPYEIGNGSYFAIAPGGGLEYRVARRIILRAEYEYQYWPAAPGIAGEPSNGLKPNGFNAGFASRIWLFGRKASPTQPLCLTLES